MKDFLEIQFWKVSKYLHIIVRNKQYLIISGGTAEDSYSDLTMIPIKMVVKIQEL